MAHMKYISYEDGTVIIFSEVLNHKDVADMMHMNARDREKIKGAGFVTVVLDDDTQLLASGMSTTLNVSSHDDDKSTIRRQINIYD